MPADGPAWKLLLSPPEVGSVERDLLIAAFDGGWITPAGPHLHAFEEELANRLGRPVVALSSGTAALHLALEGVGVTPGSDVLVSTLTFAAPAFACRYLGARPVFVDADPLTWQIDPQLVADELRRRAATNSLPAAVVAVDLYGAVADQAALEDVCATYDVPLIEDAAESLGSSVAGRPAGSFGQVATLSFNGNKIATTGGGGALAASEEIVQRARYLATQARQPVAHYEHHDVGHNYRLSNLLAAVGRGQLQTLDERIVQRRRVSDGYRKRLLSLPGVYVQQFVGQAESFNSWLTTIGFAAQHWPSRDRLLAALRNAGVEARPAFKPLHAQPVFTNERSVGGAVADRLFAEGISLPSGGAITDDEVAWVSQIIEQAR